MTAKEARKKFPLMWDTVYKSIMREALPDYDILFLRTAHTAAYNACLLMEELSNENKVENSCE
jgi:hypothetical protein